MAVPACYHLADEVFPRVRQAAAQTLVADGWSQSRAAEALGVSQAMVSRYVAADAIEDALIERLAADLVASLTGGTVAPQTWCSTLEAYADPAGDEALQDLLAAETALLAARPMALMPQIGLNMARAPRGVTDPHGVLNYPGRMIAVQDRILVPAPPSAGDGHLARCLMELARQTHGIHAMLNVRADGRLLAAARHGGHLVVDGAEMVLGDLREPDVRFQALAHAWASRHCDPDGPPQRPEPALSTKPPRLAFLQDAGAVGLEPCLYVAGPDARAIVHGLLRLYEQVFLDAPAASRPRRTTLAPDHPSRDPLSPELPTD